MLLLALVIFRALRGKQNCRDKTLLEDELIYTYDSFAN